MKADEKTDLVTFRKYNSLFAAASFQSLLRSEGIYCEIEDVSPPVDITFSVNPLHNEYRVRIKPEDFDKVNGLLAVETLLSLENISEDHFMYDFSDMELIEVLQKPDEWSMEDYIIAQKMLSSRGLEFTTQDLTTLKEKRIETLKKSRENPEKIILIGRILIFFGGIGAIAMGWYLKNFRKTIFTGERVWEFDRASRRKGHQIMIWGIVSYIIFIIFYIWLWTFLQK
jgi:hypothetical protein